MQESTLDLEWVETSMLLVNERLGYGKDVVWSRLRGPRLDGGES